MLTVNDLLENLSLKDDFANRLSVLTELNRLNQTEMFNMERAKLVVGVWDNESPINGVPATTVIKKYNLKPTDKCYFLLDAATDKIVFFQTFQPYISGCERMTVGDVQANANTHLDKLTEAKVKSKTIRTIAKKLNIELDPQITRMS